LPIAQHGTADVVQVYANLMRPAGLRQQPQRRKTVEPLQNLVERLRRPALGIVAANMVLQQWYERQGFAVTDRKRYDEVPFEVTHMALEIVQPRPHAAAIVVRRRTGDG
jgi:hypothetical protein